MPVARQLQQTYRNVPNPKPQMPVVGGEDFAEQQAWTRDIAGYNAVETFKRQASLTVGNLIGLAERWPLPGWQEAIDQSVNEFRSAVLPFHVVYDTGDLERHAERIYGLQIHNQGLADLVRRIFQHFINDMPDDLADEIEANLG